MKRLRIGLISDTHGLLRPEALAFLQGCDHIVHAGDIVGADILPRLQALAPVTAVRGNNDAGAAWADALPATQCVSLGGLLLFVLHDAAQLPRHRVPADVRVIVAGHSHRPCIEAPGVLHGPSTSNPSNVPAAPHDAAWRVNPGSAGPRRFSLPISAGELTIEGDVASVRLVDLLSGATLMEQRLA